MAVTYKSSDKDLGVPGFYVTNDATQQFELGLVISGQDVATASPYGEASFMYVKFTGATSIVAGDFVQINRYAATCIQSPATAPGASKTTFYGIAMAAQTLASATPTYGWVMLRGVHDAANVAGSGTLGNVLYGSGTAGQAATASTSNYILDGTTLRAVGTGASDATVEIDFPICSGR